MNTVALMAQMHQARKAIDKAKEELSLHSSDFDNLIEAVELLYQIVDTLADVAIEEAQAEFWGRHG